VDLFATPAALPTLQQVWRFYARGGVRTHPLFEDHFDFLRADLMPELATALEDVLSTLEQG
jgi:hypothetical protein